MIYIYIYIYYMYIYVLSTTVVPHIIYNIFITDFLDQDK